jgi:hypothetical protein
MTLHEFGRADTGAAVAGAELAAALADPLATAGAAAGAIAGVADVPHAVTSAAAGPIVTIAIRELRIFAA